MTSDNVWGAPSQMPGALLVLNNGVILFQVPPFPHLSLYFSFLSILLYFTIWYQDMWNRLNFEGNYSVLSISFSTNFLAISKWWSKFHHLTPPFLVSGKGDHPNAYIELNEKLIIFLILNSWKHEEVFFFPHVGTIRIRKVYWEYFMLKISVSWSNLDAGGLICTLKKKTGKYKANAYSGLWIF